MALGSIQVGYGTILTWNNVAIAKVTKIGEFGFEVEKPDALTFDATSAFKIAKPGMLSSPDISIEGLLATDDTTGQVALFTAAKARTVAAFVITLPTTLGTVTFTATGFWSNLVVGEITPDGFIPFKGKLTVSTVPTLAIAA